MSGLGFMQPQSDDDWSTISRVLKEEEKAEQVERAAELDSMKRAAILRRLYDRAKYKEYFSFKDDRGKITNYRKPAQLHTALYCMELRGKEPLYVTVRRGVAYLPTQYCVWMNEPCAQFYVSLVYHTQASFYILVVRKMVFKVPASILKLNYLSSTNSEYMDKLVFVAMKHIMPYRINN